jgi:16S rRNA (guanine527-N7)-methyltransferase
MTTSSEHQLSRFIESLAQNAPNFQLELDSYSMRRLGQYYSSLNRWNERLHLIAPCSPEKFATRHALESLLLIQHLPPNAAIADVGTGAGLPLIPCLIVRPDLEGYLIESSKKKAVFLSEALRETETRANIVPKRFQETPAPRVQFVTCRAIEKFSELLPEIVRWAPESCTFLFFGGEGLKSELKSAGLHFDAQLIPTSEKRFLYLAHRPR